MAKHQDVSGRKRKQHANMRSMYGTIVNINPCLFNFVVHAYGRLLAAGIRISGDQADDFRRSYDFEADAGHSHFVDGRISTTAGTIDKLLLEIISQADGA